MILWLVVSTPLKKIIKMEVFPKYGWKIKNIWNHHLVLYVKLDWHHEPGGYPNIHQTKYANMTQAWKSHQQAASNHGWSTFSSPLDVAQLWILYVAEKIIKGKPNQNSHPKLDPSIPVAIFAFISHPKCTNAKHDAVSPTWNINSFDCQVIQPFMKCCNRTPCRETSGRTTISINLRKRWRCVGCWR